jgi:hypothetical protein
MAAYWRIRLKDGNRRDFSGDAWDRNEVGIWYGAWSAPDLENAIQGSTNTGDISAYLSDLPAQRNLGWNGNLQAGYVNTALRFRNIPNGDWVVLYLSASQEIGLATICSELGSDPKHPFNSCGELFKYRGISDKKTFKLSRLPDAYRLLPTQGRGNIHEFNTMWEHVKLLADHRTEQDINQVFRQKPFDELLDLLGASAWESFCFAYLILEKDFVPTGLSTGRTLPTADIVGRRKTDGGHIVAQCKKHASPQPVDPDFIGVSESLAPNDAAYYFAYGGCVGEVPKNLQVIDRAFALRWADSQNGRLYKRLLLERD